MGDHLRRRGERGAALVEFALIVPVLACILVGTVTGGFALATKNSMTNAVRESARLGATLPEGADWDSWAVIVRDRAVELAGDDLAEDQVCVAVVTYDSAGTPAETELGSWPTTPCPIGGAPSVPANTPDGSCVVKVWAERAAELDALFFSKDLTLRASAVGRYERPGCP